MSYVIQASPLSKLYMRGMAEVIEQNPALVYEATPFKVLIPRSAGAIEMVHNEPVLASKLLKRSPNQLRDLHNFNELENLVMWLTGGPDGTQSQETDIYGVVELEIDLDFGPEIFSITQTKKDDNALVKLQKKITAQAADAIVKARDIADMRVKRALKMTHNNLVRQYEEIKTAGGQPYAPSAAEYIGSLILRTEVNKANEMRKKRFDQVVETMGNQATGIV